MTQRRLSPAPSLAFKTIALALIVALGGCATRQVDKDAAPQMDVPDNWSRSNIGAAGTGPAQAEQLWPDSDWWKQFGSNELSMLVDESQQNNFEIAAAFSRVRQAEAQARLAGAPLLPAAGVNINAARNLPISGGSPSNTAGATLDVSYEIDFWGKNRAGRDAAEASLRANRYDRETVALTVTSGVVSTYLQVLSLRDRLEIARQNVSTAERVLKLVEAQSRAGSASPLDLARQRSALANQRALIPDLQQQEQDAQTALAILLGRPPQNFTVQEKGLMRIQMPRISAGLPSELLTRRPDIRRAEANLEAASANVAVARAALFPSITLTGSTGAQSSALLSLFDGPNLFASIGAGLIAPIFDGGRLQNQRDLAIAQKEELVQVYRQRVINSLSEVEKALGAIRSLEERYRLKTGEVDQARFAFELSEIRYRAGAEDLMVVLDTQRALSEAQNQLGQIKLQRLQATVSLYKALGGGWQDNSASSSTLAP
ncbi:efflux transporter outer membrane subunit [Herbaspirillum sp. YR522]|uniref:efflux transporter outer membrane subunit n=1 Tax=Herbaspirillum sp. YR522 TaxID=1144342 RepID=UPI00026F6D7C|nr:efflux transporter outer membrane subunit [Herbaspirillum sp. YR522]EJN09359.1 efflux transporter, outer membrane factor lipoprotein, NodT family [Herbaspirillum sp. YR522]